MKSNNQIEAYNYILKLLAQKNYARSMLLNKLLSKGFSLIISEEAIVSATNKNIFNEENYTQSQVKNLIKKGFSPEYIIKKLVQVDIILSSEEVLDYFCENSITPSEQINNILESKLPKNLESLERASQIKAINKVCLFLNSKGHSIDIYEYFSFLS